LNSTLDIRSGLLFKLLGEAKRAYALLGCVGLICGALARDLYSVTLRCLSLDLCINGILTGTGKSSAATRNNI
jgi:hypothetical protein